MEAEVDIIRLKPGERAPDNSDRIQINSFPDGKNGWTGAIAVGGEGVFGIGKNEYQTRTEAEVEAIAWAKKYNVSELTIEADNG